MDYMTLNRITVTHAEGTFRVNYDYSCPVKMEKYIKKIQSPFFFEVSDKYDIRKVPESILAIPFVACMLTVTMPIGLGIRVPTLSKKFIGCLPEIEKIYKKMFSTMNWKTNVVSDKVEIPQLIGGG